MDHKTRIKIFETLTADYERMGMSPVRAGDRAFGALDLRLKVTAEGCEPFETALADFLADNDEEYTGQHAEIIAVINGETPFSAFRLGGGAAPLVTLERSE